MNRKNKKQFVEHYEEHIGEDMTPFVAHWSKENQMKTTDANQQNMNVSPVPILTTSTRKKKIRFWRRLTAIFS